jgi:hypothetical protein
LKQKAAQFGLDPAAVDAMKQPVLTREIPDSVFGEPGMSKANAIGDFNKKGTAELTPAERAIADSRRVSPQTLDDLGGRLDAAGPNATLAQSLTGQAGLDVLHNLIGDGVISMQERAGLANADGLTPAGRQRISALVGGRFFSDPATMDSIPASVRAKVERAAAPLARVDGVPEWDLTPHMRDAMDLVNEAAAHGSTVDDYIKQAGFFGNEAFSPKATALAKAFTESSTSDLLKGAKQYAGDAAFAAGGDSMFGDGADSTKAFTDAFGGKDADIRATPATSTRVKRAPAAAQSFYHGTSARDFAGFHSGLAHLAEDPDEAAAYSKIGGGGNPATYKVLAKAGTTIDIDPALDADRAALKYRTFEQTAADARAQGARYMTHTHPSFQPGGADFRVTTSLYPDQDLSLGRATVAGVAAGPEALAALKAGRAATAAKYQALQTLDKLPNKGVEGVGTFNHLLMAKDASYARLSNVLDQTPALRPVLGRALI